MDRRGRAGERRWRRLRSRWESWRTVAARRTAPAAGDAAPAEAAIPSEAADTASLPLVAEPDDPDPTADSAEAAARTGGPDGESSDAAGELGDTTDSLSATDSLATIDDSTAAEPPPPPLRIPPGTRVQLAAETDISTDAYDVGDPVIATVVRDVLDDEGEVLISAGTYFLGRVEASTSSGGIGEPAILEVAFETLSAWNYERPIEGIVVQVSVTLDEEAERARRTARGRDAMRMVPGVIRAGTTIVVQLRDPVFVPPLDTLAVPPDSSAIPPDSTPTGGLPGTAAAGDAVSRTRS